MPRPWPLWLKLRLSFLVPTHPHQGIDAAKVLDLEGQLKGAECSKETSEKESMIERTSG